VVYQVQVLRKRRFTEFSLLSSSDFTSELRQVWILGFYVLHYFYSIDPADGAYGRRTVSSHRKTTRPNNLAIKTTHAIV
jgi:hypothetical protein